MIQKKQNISALNGLVLAGGKSRRMGEDKDLIQWHGKQQRYHVADMLIKFCEDVCISCRPEQVKEIDPFYKALPDTFKNIGPLGGILTALHSQRDKALLVVACDLPLLDEETIHFLMMNRKSDKIATTYLCPADGLPETLITIWEPASYSVLLSYYLNSGITSLREVLMNNDIFMITPPYPETLLNVNTPEDARNAVKILLTRDESFNNGHHRLSSSN